MRFAILTLLLALPALADVADDKLGAAYTDAAPAEKLALLAVAKTDKTLDTREVTAAHDNVVLAYVAPGENAEAQLRLHGELRSAAMGLLDTINAARKESGARRCSFVEPSMAIQQALATAYLAESAGASPSLEQLGGLAMVRECTSWSHHTSLVYAAASEALNREAAYREADVRGKLAIIKHTAEERAMLSDHERTLLEKPLISGWIAAGLAEGRTGAELKEELAGLKREKLVCFFTSSWADKFLDGLGTLGR